MVLTVVLVVLGLMTAMFIYSGIRGWQHENKKGKRLVALAEAEEALRKPMRVMVMHATGFVRITHESGERVEQLPASPLGHGEFPRAIAGSADGRLYVAGKLYTGKPGPDDGVIYARATDGTWRIAFALEGRTFQSIVVTADGGVYAGTKGGYAHFDGERWQVCSLPTDVYCDVIADEGRVFASPYQAPRWFELEGATATPCEPRAVPKHDALVHRAEGITYRVFDRSTEVGERTLSADESAEIRGELVQVARVLRDAGKEP